METTFYDVGGVVIGNPTYRDALLVYADEDTLVPGTILAYNADNNLVPCNPDALDVTAVAVSVLTVEDSRTSAGSNSIRELVVGHVRRDKLLNDGGQDVTFAQIEALRSRGIIAERVEELNQLDNN